jgi:hypothetical protein
MRLSTRYPQAFWLVLAVLAATGWARAQDDPNRYADAMEGYSLVVPAEASRGMIQADDRRRGLLGKWQIAGQNKQTGASNVMVTITTRRVVFERREDDLKDWLNQGILTDVLSSADGMEVTSSRMVAIDGHPALQLAGTWNMVRLAEAEPGQDEPEMAFREAWIRVKTGTESVEVPGTAEEKPRTVDVPFTNFFIMRLTMPIGADIDRQWAKLVGSLRLTDPTEAIKDFEQSITNAQNVVSRVHSRKTLADALPQEPQWYLVRRNGRTIGWEMTQGGPENREEGMDWGLRTYTFSKPPKGAPSMESRGRYVGRDFEAERWTIRQQIGSGQASRLMVERGLRQEGRVFVEAHAGNDVRMYTAALEPFVQTVYLSKLSMRLLPRFIATDLPKMQSYTFAEYVTETDEFLMRTFTVAGRVRLKTTDETMVAYKILEKPNFNELPQTLYVDTTGRVLRVDMAGGVTKIAVSRQRVLQDFGSALKIIKAVRKAEERSGAF